MYDLLNSNEPGDYLVTPAEMGELIDEKASTIHRWLSEDPDRIPQPAYVNGFAVWPLAQLDAWRDTNFMKGFARQPDEFVPAPLARYFKTENEAVTWTTQ